MKNRHLKPKIQIKGLLSIIVLCVLADKEKHHLAGILLDIDRIGQISNEYTDRKSVFDTLKALKKNGDVIDFPPVQARKLVYYSITTKGIATTAQKIDEIKRVRMIMFKFCKRYPDLTRPQHDIAGAVIK